MMHMQEVGVAGYYYFELNGEMVFEAPSKNLITNFGWTKLSNLIYSNSALGQIHVGTSNTPPAYTDTALGSFLAATASGGGAFTEGNGTDGIGEYAYIRTAYAFALGAVVGNVTEVGFKVVTADAALTSRSLVKDGAGNPATIVVTATDTLTVHYELRYYRAPLDITSSVTVSGTPTTYVLRTAAKNSGLVGGGTGLIGGFTFDAITVEHYGTGSTLGAPGVDPSAGFQTNALFRVAASPVVTVGTGTTTVTLTTPTIGLGAGNVSGGVLIATFLPLTAGAGNQALGAYGNIKASFTPAIPKGGTSTLSYGLSFTFTRL